MIRLTKDNAKIGMRIQYHYIGTNPLYNDKYFKGTIVAIPHTCHRMNDMGVSVCWCCGNRP